MISKLKWHWGGQAAVLLKLLTVCVFSLPNAYLLHCYLYSLVIDVLTQSQSLPYRAHTAGQRPERLLLLCSTGTLQTWGESRVSVRWLSLRSQYLVSCDVHSQHFQCTFDCRFIQVHCTCRSSHFVRKVLTLTKAVIFQKSESPLPLQPAPTVFQ